MESRTDKILYFTALLSQAPLLYFSIFFVSHRFDGNFYLKNGGYLAVAAICANVFFSLRFYRAAYRATSTSASNT